jgi:hypothetical protein
MAEDEGLIPGADPALGEISTWTSTVVFRSYKNYDNVWPKKVKAILLYHRYVHIVQLRPFVN